MVKSQLFVPQNLLAWKSTIHKNQHTQLTLFILRGTAHSEIHPQNRGLHKERSRKDGGKVCLC